MNIWFISVLFWVLLVLNAPNLVWILFVIACIRSIFDT